MIFQRIRFHLRFAQIVFAEIIFVDDQDSVFLQVRDIHFQRGRVHRHQRIHGISRSKNIRRGKLNLETAHSRQRAGRSANLSGIIGKRRKVISIQSHSIRELVSGNLHSVAGIAAKPDYRAVQNLAFSQWNFDSGRHNSPWSQASIFGPQQPHRSEGDALEWFASGPKSIEEEKSSAQKRPRRN